ncbi:glycosyltransferase family 2 protein [Marinovum sp.]|uniref:glycosyltransferase family 2 protein n=1 Tax=Marinovum sp. TaxID=2024839 RepID=UPI002B27A08E|nr:glycosyltransferase family 2 protein [Marinovum sp.]
MQATAVLCLRNEAAFLLDWLAHHRAVGFSHVVICTNDCSDGTDLIADRLAALGGVTHIRNEGPYDRSGIQFTALKLAGKVKPVRQADWLMALDIDEYVNIHVGGHRLPDLIAVLPEATAITLTWRLFGNGGEVAYRDAPVSRVFTRAAPEVMHWPWRAQMFKTLYRNDGSFRQLGVHRPRGLREGHAVHWRDCEGRAPDLQAHDRRVFSPPGQRHIRLAQLNHYALGAMESFVLKSARGRAVHSDHRLGLDYWTERNFNTDEDRTLLRLAPEVDKERARLAADAELSRLHAEAVAWRHARFAALMQDEPARALFGRLLMTPPSQPLPPEVALRLHRHARKARPASP